MLFNKFSSQLYTQYTYRVTHKECYFNDDLSSLILRSFYMCIIHDLEKKATRLKVKEVSSCVGNPVYDKFFFQKFFVELIFL